MKYCAKCGHELQNDAILCPNCGCLVQSENTVEKVEDGKNGNLNINFSLFLGIYVLYNGLICLIGRYYVNIETILRNAIFVVFCVLNAVPDFNLKSNKKTSALLGFIFSMAGFVLLFIKFILYIIKYT